MSLAAVLYTKNLDRLVEFYTTLGLIVDESEHGDYAVLIGPGVELSIVQVPEPIASQIEISSPPQVRSRTPIMLVFSFLLSKRRYKPLSTSMAGSVTARKDGSFAAMRFKMPLTLKAWVAFGL